MVYIRESSYNTEKNKMTCVRKNDNGKLLDDNLYDEFFSLSERDDNNVDRTTKYNDKKIIDHCLYNYKILPTLKNKNKLIKARKEYVHNNIFSHNYEEKKEKNENPDHINFKGKKAYSVENTSIDCNNKIIYRTNSFKNDVNLFNHYNHINYRKKKEMEIKSKSKTNNDKYKEIKNMRKKKYINFYDIMHCNHNNKYYDVIDNKKKNISFLLSYSNDNIYRNKHMSIFNNIEKRTTYPNLRTFESINNISTNINYKKKYFQNVRNKFITHNNYNDITEGEENKIIKINMSPIDHSTNSSPVTRYNNIFSVKFLCQAKCYNLIKISHIFFSKQITYKWFDNYNILCAFLCPDKEDHQFYSSADFYKIENLNLKKNVASSKSSKYIVFIFKNGSVIIWKNFNNHEKNDNFINKILLFLNSFSDELLPAYLQQEDTIFYFQGKEHNKFNHQYVTNMQKKKKKKKKKKHIIKNNSKQNDNNSYNKTSKQSEMKIKKKKLKFKTSYEQKSKKDKKINTVVNNGVIYLTNKSLEQKLTASFALSQSIQLDVHEMMMDIAINTLFKISKEIANNGTCIISKEKIATMMHVYSSIINVNAVQDFLDIPEYFWNKVEYEHAWFEVYKYMEIPERIKILNKRYNYYKDFLKVIKTEVYNKKTFYTYRIVVLLLFIHVMALLLNDFLFVK
ncbi:conserved protein, unknown function [Plasmodium gaboni]|uniref:DUF155 domain-containing protein n=1 Tax=Plasmodium gaboni TaxID=647221 RepID=A0ABY1UMZ5_9APIC|nr:conserved protein, unknown function [Plasmodium gaboni]